MTQELIVLVDKSGKPIGTTEKLPSHHAKTPLHLAFSCYVFNDRGQLLVTQRAESKKVWPGVWTNTLCGHLAPGETTLQAIKRRLRQELGIQAADFKVALPDYRYKTPPFNGIIENEICPVYVARANVDPKPNPEEVEAWRWMSWHDYIQALENDRGYEYSWWCKDQLKQLKDHPLIKVYTAA